MSTLAAPGGSKNRSRSKSPGRRERDRSPAGRAVSPPGGRSRDKKEKDDRSSRAVSPPRRDRGDERSRGFDYDAPAAYGYAAPPQVPDAPPDGRHPSYSHTATPQYDTRRHSPPPGAYPGYAQPGPHPYASNVSPAYQQYPLGSQISAEVSHRPAHRPGEQPHQQPYYATPGAYQNAEGDKHGKGSKDKHGERDGGSRGVSVNTSSGFNMNIGHGGHQQPTPQYGQPASGQYPPSYGHPQGRPGSHDYPVDKKTPGRRPSDGHHGQAVPGPAYAHPAEYQYAPTDERISYKYNQGGRQPGVTYVEEAHGGRPYDHGGGRHDEHRHDGRHDEHRHDGRHEESNIIEVKPSRHGRTSSPPGRLHDRMHSLSVSTGSHSGALTLSAQPHGHHGPIHPGSLPPGSPLLEAYQGTYQSISPMPSPMMLPHMRSDSDSSISDLGGLSGHDSDDSLAARRRRQKKRVKFYDPEADARELAESLRHRTVDAAPLIEILPALNHDQILQLRTEYKKHAKVQGKGINIAKHIKMKIPTSAFGKICYATALGRWESEAYWANFWYQSNTSRRELLIESLMGRTNTEIRAIKDAFSDKRYGDSLEKCMKAELKADKFRTAVLLVLEERRMEESGFVRGEQVRDDARRLHDALEGVKGGETAMIQVVVTRSDAHMREVLRVYEKSYGKNFAKEMLRKSTNLVGETLAHILNGLINRPVRDALLLHQAISETSKERNELLISRLVRYHWDRPHLEAIKREFRSRYGKELATALAEGTRGDFGEFCVEAVIKR